jgi:hypothetical protein
MYLSTKCVRTCLEWIAHIKLVPITYADDLFEKFAYKVDYTMRQYRPLDVYKMSTEDNVRQLLIKYF